MSRLRHHAFAHLGPLVLVVVLAVFGSTRLHPVSSSADKGGNATSMGVDGTDGAPHAVTGRPVLPVIDAAAPLAVTATAAAIVLLALRRSAGASLAGAEAVLTELGLRRRRRGPPIVTG